MTRARVWQARDTASEDPTPVFLTGAIDLMNADANADLLCALVDLRPGPVLLVDCTDVTLVGSQCMAMMRRVHDHATDRGVRVVWDGLAPLHRRTLHAVGVDRRLHLAPPEAGHGAVRPPSTPRH